MGKLQTLPRRAGWFAYGALAGVFLLLWLSLWTYATVLMDVACVRTLARQSWATTFPSVPGTVVRNERISRMTKSGTTTFDVRLVYAYTIAGLQYECDRERFVPGGFDLAWADAHPVGSQLTVFYNPSDPADAGLEPGIRAGDLVFPMVLPIFNAIALSGWWSAFGVLRGNSVGRERALRQIGERNLLARPGCVFVVITIIVMATGLIVLGIWAGRGGWIVVPLAAWTAILIGLVRLFRRVA